MKRKIGFSRSVLFSLIVLLIVLALPGVSSSAEKFPSKEILIIVPYTAGGPVDLTTRVLAEYLQKELGVPVVVDNRPEAGGVKGVVDGYRAKPDGYTLLFTLFPRYTQTEVIYKAPYKVLDLTYLATFYRQDTFVVVQKDSPYKTVKDLIEASKRKSLNCAIAGMGSLSHFTALLLKKKVSIDLEVVPFKGTAPALIALLGGNVDLLTLDQFTMLVNREKAPPLAVFSEKRSKKVPDVPTLMELGYDIKVGYSLSGICGPPGLPEEIYKILSDGLYKAIKNPEFISKLEKMGPNVVYMDGPTFYTEAKSFYKLVEEYKDIFLEQK